MTDGMQQQAPVEEALWSDDDQVQVLQPPNLNGDKAYDELINVLEQE